MDITKENALLVLKKYLGDTNQEKFAHSIRVAKVCKILAEKWDVSLKDDAIIAGLLHDIGKSMNKQNLLSLCIRKNLTVHDFELFESPMALHGKVSSLLFEDEFRPQQENQPDTKLENLLKSKIENDCNQKSVNEIENIELERFQCISHAISCHVAGDENMNLLDKIVFIADNVEPERKNDTLSKIQSDIISNPDDCIKIIINGKISRSIKKKRKFNPLLRSTLDSLER